MVKDKGKATLQQISDVAWLVRQGKNKLGILNKDVQNHYFYIINSKNGWVIKKTELNLSPCCVWYIYITFIFRN